ncbi:MAG: AmmeMemoRadiSam system radical SAM enzyme [Spirochaetales bacterium]|nr:AmmeMemoRadiSam system radical SAM enzyme [Spirochaetales bacterium]
MSSSTLPAPLPQFLATPFWVPAPDNAVRCLACFRECVIPPGGTGFCRVRVNQKGKLVRPYEAMLSAWQNDPIEKKPLYHFLPGSRVMSFGGWGCNFICPWCQNHPISQKLPLPHEYRPTSPSELVQMTLDAGVPSLAMTYNEPTVAIEFARETFLQAHEAGLKTVLVTNGSLGARGVRFLAPVLDAVNVDLKSFNTEKLRKVVAGELGAVLAAIETFRSEGVWTEVDTLVVPDFNDSLSELKDIARWLAGIGRSTVWHLTQYHPDYRYRLPPVPEKRLYEARDQGFEAGLKYIYLGNLGGGSPVSGHDNTICPECQALLVERPLDSTLQAFHGQCQCGTTIPGIWS